MTADTSELPVTIVDGHETQLTVPREATLPSLSGRIWHDANGDRIAGSDEHGLADWTVYIDSNNNLSLDEDETRTQTRADDPDTAEVDESGTYTFMGLEPGSYNIRHVAPDSWLSYPLVTSDTPFERYANRFGNQFVRLTGTDFGRPVATFNASTFQEFDFVAQDDVFYGLATGDLVTFGVDGDTFTEVGEIT